MVALDVDVEYVVVKKEQCLEGLVLGGAGNVAVDGEVREVGLHVLCV